MRSTLLISVVLAAGAPARAEVVIVADGKAAAVVVTPKGASEVVRYAAAELVHHVAKATGVKLAVVREGDAPRPRPAGSTSGRAPRRPTRGSNRPSSPARRSA